MFKGLSDSKERAKRHDDACELAYNSIQDLTKTIKLQNFATTLDNQMKNSFKA